jgi:hypothetical protein
MTVPSGRRLLALLVTVVVRSGSPRRANPAVTIGHIFSDTFASIARSRRPAC